MNVPLVDLKSFLLPKMFSICRYFSIVRSNDLILQGSEILQSLQCPRLPVHFNFLWLERLIALEGPFWTQIRDVKKMSNSSKITHLDRYSVKCKVSMITILICPSLFCPDDSSGESVTAPYYSEIQRACVNGTMSAMKHVRQTLANKNSRRCKILYFRCW